MIPCQPSSAGGTYEVDEGSSVTLTAEGSDPFGDPLTYAWDLDNNGSFETSGQSVSYAGVDDLVSFPVSVQVADPAGQTAVDDATVTVNNVAPTVGAITAPVAPVALGTEVAASAGFTDPGTADTHTALFDWGDGATSAGEVNAGLASGTHSYATPGVYGSLSPSPTMTAARGSPTMSMW